LVWWTLLNGPAVAFDCAPATCPKIKTCAEARYKLEVCHDVARDRDGDGIPCEDLCGSDKATYEARSTATVPEVAGPAPSPDVSNALLGDTVKAPNPPNSAGFACAGKRTCKQMVSCEEATFYLKICGVSSLDGNRDGRPCNSLCR
jgi:Excalibur calcium-binding domain